MSKVNAKAYLSPTLVLLALDWPEGAEHDDFLGFAIKRAPGFWNFKKHHKDASSWLPNRIGFDGPAPNGGDLPSDEAPIQKFMWWDARIDEDDRRKSFHYEIWPVRGTKDSHALVQNAKTEIKITLPAHEERGIGTYFNRAVVSSQAFAHKIQDMGIAPNQKPSAQQELVLRTWLANDMEQVVQKFLAGARDVVGAIYHLTDRLWIIPELDAFSKSKPAAMVYDAKPTRTKSGTKPGPNAPVVKDLGRRVKFYPRDKSNIMHDKFIVSGDKLRLAAAAPARVVCGSANYTTEGLTSQANLMHTFDSAPLARLYLERFNLLKPNPTLAKTAAANAGWSNTITVGDAGVRLFFSPEPSKARASIDTIVRAVHGARSSVLFCLFMPTDAELRDACFAVGDNDKMMFGLVNHIAEPKPGTKADASTRADELAKIELYHRFRDNHDTIGAEFFDAKHVPAGFEVEQRLFPGEAPPPYPPVIIHHKFVIIDAETDSPIIYTGSANMSKNSVNGNDENLLEIRGSKRLAAIYLAEFMRLYEHYRARAYAIKDKKAGGGSGELKLAKDRAWARKHYTPGTPEYKARIAMVKY